MKNISYYHSLSAVIIILSNIMVAHAAGTVYQNTNTTESIELSNISDANTSQVPIATDTSKPALESQESTGLSIGIVNPAMKSASQNDQSSENVIVGIPIKGRTDDEVAKVMHKYHDTMVQNGNRQGSVGSSAASRRYLMVDKNTFINSFNK